MSEKKKSSFLDELDSAEDVVAKSDKVEKYKAPDKGKKNRIGFPLLKPNGRLALKTLTFFKGEINGKFTTFAAPKDAELHRIAEKKLGKPVTRYLTIVCKYPIKKSGEVSSSGDYELFLLVMDPKKYTAIQSIDQSWGYKRVDLEVTSSNPDYQDMSFMPSEPSVWATNKNYDKQAIVDEALELAELMVNSVTNDWSDDRIREALGLDDEDEDDDEEADTGLDDDEDEDDEDEKPAPKKKSKRHEDEEDDDEDEDDEPVKPKKGKKPVVEDDEDDEDEKPTPKKKAKGDFDDFVENKPKGKKPVVEDDEEDDDDEDEKPAPKGKKPVIDDDEEDEEDKPKKKRRPVIEDDDEDDE
jgi:hypothetical protein